MWYVYIHTCISLRVLDLGFILTRTTCLFPRLVPFSLSFLHFYLKYTQPLFIQSIMAAKGIYDAKPVKIHLFGQPATGDLQRPFATAPGMMGRSFNPLPLAPACSDHMFSSERND
jgi:hypothetical protein